MRIAFLLPGIHNVNRGAEVAFESVASHIAGSGVDDVTVFGSGPDRPDQPYAYKRAPFVRREHFERAPMVPPFRTNYIYEELTWTAAAFPKYRPSQFDVTLTCSFPFVHWMTTRWPLRSSSRPKHIFVTQNGDHPALTDRFEYRSFTCDGLVCTNPLYLERERERWPSTLIPNGIDPDRFRPGPSRRHQYDLPEDAPVVLMVSALVETKRVLEGMAAVAAIPDAYLIVAGDGPLRDEFDATGERLMPGRFRRLTVPSQEMPYLYRSADVLLHPALFESFGNIYIEAMAVGLPVVAHDSIVTRWIFGDEPGLVDTTDTATVTAAVAAVLSGDRDELATRSAEAHRRFSWSTIAQQYRAFAADVLSGSVDGHP
jgi:glycosyltransferase involved in cell wall biosynthesis